MPPPPEPAPAPPSTTFWQHRVVEPVVKQMTQGITPEKIALTLAVGGACAVFPIVGTTTLLCLIVGIALRLNQPIIQVVNGIMTPIHIPLIFLFIRVGDLIFRTPHVRVNLHYLTTMFWDHPWVLFHRFDLAMLHAIVGWAVLSPVAIALVYSVALPTLREIMRQRGKTPVPHIVGETPDHPTP